MAGLLRREPAAATSRAEKNGMQQYGRLRIELFALEHLLALLAGLQDQLASVGSELNEMKRVLDGISEQFYDPKKGKGEFHVLVDEDDLEEQNLYLTSIVSRSLFAQAARIAERLDKKFQKGFFAQSGGLHDVLAAASKERRELPDVLQAEARSEVLSALNETDLVQIILDSELNESQTQAILHKCLERAWPPILRCGGSKRLVLALPDLPSSESFTRIITEKLGEPATVARRPEGSLALCYEAEQIPLSNVVFALLENRPEREKYAARLHTRVDVNWPPMMGNG